MESFSEVTEVLGFPFNAHSTKQNIKDICTHITDTEEHRALLTEEQMAEYEKSMEELGASVPDDLKDDLEVVTTAYNTYFKEVGSVLKDGDFLSSADELEAAGKALEAPEVEEANANIEAYLNENCG